MKLSDWLSQQQISNAEFARRTGISEPMVSLLTSGKTWLSRTTAERIAKATGGAVTPNDFLIEAAE